MNVRLNVTNADLQIGGIKINSVSSSAIVILGDAQEINPQSVSITRGIQAPAPITPTGPVGQIGSIQ